MAIWLYRIRPARPSMLTEGPTPEEQHQVGLHFAYLKDLCQQGVVHLGICRAWPLRSRRMACAMLTAEASLRPSPIRLRIGPYRPGFFAAFLHIPPVCAAKSPKNRPRQGREFHQRPKPDRLLAGRTLDTGPDSMGIVLFSARDEAEARVRMERDPAVAGGVFQATLHAPGTLPEGGFHGFSGQDQPARIDRILSSEELRPVRAWIDRESVQGVVPSDHHPVVAVFSPPGEGAR